MRNSIESAYFASFLKFQEKPFCTWPEGKFPIEIPSGQVSIEFVVKFCRRDDEIFGSALLSLLLVDEFLDLWCATLCVPIGPTKQLRACLRLHAHVATVRE
jgi:hypothetical protein